MTTTPIDKSKVTLTILGLFIAIIAGIFGYGLGTTAHQQTITTTSISTSTVTTYTLITTNLSQNGFNDIDSLILFFMGMITLIIIIGKGKL